MTTDQTNHPYVIVRCEAAGVHAGRLLGYEGRTVHLADSRRLWRWWCNEGISLSGVATSGLRHDKSRITQPVEHVTLLDACEIITCTEAARDSIVGAPVAEQQ